jgi:hypothetical protein
MLYPFPFMVVYMRVAICSSLVFKDKNLFNKKMNELLLEFPDLILVTSNTHNVDMWAGEFAYENNIKCDVIKVDFERFGKNATFVRNHLMLECSDMTVAFNTKDARSTNYMIKISKKANKRVDVYKDLAE